MNITDKDVRDEFRDAQKMAGDGNAQQGGGPGASDRDAAGGSSGGGGYGNAQDQELAQGQTGGPDEIGDGRPQRELSRGERLDIEANGGRGPDQVDWPEDMAADAHAHSDQGQGFIASDGETDTGVDDSGGTASTRD